MAGKSSTAVLMEQLLTDSKYLLALEEVQRDALLDDGLVVASELEWDS
jgi:hypothetical protein